MNLTPKHLYIALGILALILAGFLAVGAYMASKVLVTKADQVHQDMQPIHQEAQAEKQSAAHAEDLNQKTFAAAMAAIAAQKQQPIRTEVDYNLLADMVAQRMGGAHAEIKADPQHPDAPSAVMPAKALRDYMLDCDGKTAEISACRVTVDNTEKKLQAEIKDHAATKKELQAARTAMKGGSFWSRLKGNSKWFIVGGAAGAGAVLATHR